MPVCTFHSEYTLNKSTQTQMRYHFKRERDRYRQTDRWKKIRRKKKKEKSSLKAL